jgi:hypothetical protein
VIAHFLVERFTVFGITFQYWMVIAPSAYCFSYSISPVKIRDDQMAAEHAGSVRGPRVPCLIAAMHIIRALEGEGGVI